MTSVRELFIKCKKAKYKSLSTTLYPVSCPIHEFFRERQYEGHLPQGLRESHLAIFSPLGSWYRKDYTEWFSGDCSGNRGLNLTLTNPINRQLLEEIVTQKGVQISSYRGERQVTDVVKKFWGIVPFRHLTFYNDYTKSREFPEAKCLVRSQAGAELLDEYLNTINKITSA